MGSPNDIAPLPPGVWGQVLERLVQLLREPSTELPCVQVLRETDLRHCLRLAWREVAAQAKVPTGQLLANLCQDRIACQLPLTDPTEDVPAMRLWHLGFGIAGEPNPLELLQAVKPRGIISYFSALSYHELTTQIPGSHHLVELTTGERKPMPEDGPLSPHIPAPGTLLFHHMSTPYYCSLRMAWMVPGVQRAYLSDKAIIRVTTLEQTLLDTLHRPWNCGGPPVVFEAWERALDSLDEERLGQYLASIQHPLLTRRAGCMLDRIGWEITNPGLSRILASARETAATAPEDFFLPAVPGTWLDPVWRLRGEP